MSKTGKKLNPWNIVLLFLGVAISLFATYKTIYYGYDIDESYAITLSYRLVMGDHLFKEMWEVHQTSAIFMAPFIWIYRHVVGTTIGMVVFLRAVGCVIQLLVAIALYHSLSKHIDKVSSCVIAFIFYNFSPKYLNVLEFCFLQYLFMTLILIFLLYYFDSPKKRYLFLVGICLAGTVLAYPQTVLLFPAEYMILAFMFIEKEGATTSLKNLLYVFTGEAICGILFLAYVLKNVTLVELFRNIPMVLADQSHSIDATEKVIALLTELWQKSYFLILIFIVYEIACFLYRKTKGKEPSYAKELCLFFIWVFWIVPFMLHDEQPGICHLDTFYLIFSECIGIGYLNLRTKKPHAMAGILRMMQLLLLCIVMGASVSSNLWLYANGGLLLPVTFPIWAEYILNRTVEEEESAVTARRKKAGMALLVSAALAFMLALCTLVRFTALHQETVFSKLHQISIGTAKDIYATEKEHVQYHSKMAALQQYVGVEDTLLYLGSDAYLYFLIGNQVGVSTSISTPAFDQTMVEYYERYPYKTPNIIFADKYYVKLKKIQYEGEFGKWLRQNYDLEHVIDDDWVQIIYRKQ